MKQKKVSPTAIQTKRVCYLVPDSVRVIDQSCLDKFICNRTTLYNTETERLLSLEEENIWRKTMLWCDTVNKSQAIDALRSSAKHNVTQIKSICMATVGNEPCYGVVTAIGDTLWFSVKNNYALYEIHVT